MKLPARSRLIALLGTGLVLIALAALGVRGGRRGVSYYFPVWVGPGWSDSVERERFDELPEIAHSLPIVLAGIERQPSELGEKWGPLRDGLPNFIKDRLPQYRGAIWGPLLWLNLNCSEPEVAKAVTNRWPRWRDEVRINWLHSLAPAAVASRQEYRPMLQLLCQSTNAPEALCAAYLLGAYRPIPDGDARLLVHAWTNHLLASVEYLERMVTLQLASLDKASPTVVASLQSSLTSANRLRAALAAVALAKLVPADFPPQTTLEPIWQGLSHTSAKSVLSVLQRPEFRSVASSAWGVGFLAKLLAAAQVTSLPKVAPSSLNVAALVVLETLGPAGVEAAPAIWMLLAGTNAPNQREAARAFAAVAQSSPDYLTAIQPYLTNELTAAPLLLWLTSLGTNASRSKDTVQQLATEAIRFPELDYMVRYQIDPILARRYGLIPRAPSVSSLASKSTAAKEPLRKPSEVEVIARENCPRALLHLWPGFDEIHPLVANKFSDSSSDGYFQALVPKLPKSNLAELARRCLQSMANGLPPSPPADPR